MTKTCKQRTDNRGTSRVIPLSSEVRLPKTRRDAQSSQDVKPVLRDIPQTMKRLSIRSRTTIYSLAAKGLLDMRKVLGKSLITEESIDRLLEEAPRA